MLGRVAFNQGYTAIQNEFTWQIYTTYNLQYRNFAICPVRDSCLGKYDWQSHWWHWESPHLSSEICGEDQKKQLLMMKSLTLPNGKKSASTTKNIWLVKHLRSIMVCDLHFLNLRSQNLQPEQREISKNWISPHSNCFQKIFYLSGTICPWKSEKKHPLIILNWPSLEQMF